MVRYNYLLFFSLFLVCSCTAPQEKKTQSKTETADLAQLQTGTNAEKVGRTNYAVVWKWTTDDTQLVADNSTQISKELTDLWQADIVENAYFDTEAKEDKLDYFPNITFFLKAHGLSEAKAILNKLTVVKKGIARYQLFPVGQLWLDRKTERINKHGVKKSFVAVWTSQQALPAEKEGEKLLKRQNDLVFKLWNEGIIENVYFDIEGTNKTNDKADFVFFVNADTEAEAKKICESLPFFQQRIANFQLFQAGVFWMGKHDAR